MAQTVQGRARDDAEDEVPPVPRRQVPQVPDDDIVELPDEQLPGPAQNDVPETPDPTVPPVGE